MISLQVARLEPPRGLTKTQTIKLITELDPCHNLTTFFKKNTSKKGTKRHLRWITSGDSEEFKKQLIDPMEMGKKWHIKVYPRI